MDDHAMSAASNADMHSFWNSKGGHKWMRFQNEIEAGMGHLGERVMDVLQLRPNERVLDIGCGAGASTREIARRVAPDGYVQGIDISLILLEQAHLQNTSTEQGRLHFEYADAQNHPLDAMSFDAAFSRLGVMFFDDPAAAFANIRHALKPDGRLGFVCWQAMDRNAWVQLPLQLVKAHGLTPPAHDPGKPGAFAFSDADRIRFILSEAGFREPRIEHFDTTVRLGADLDEAVIFLMHIGPASAALEEPGVDSKSRTRYAYDLYERLTPYLTDEGVKLDAACWLVTACN